MTGLTAFSQALVLFLTLFTMMVGLLFTIVPPIPGILMIWGAAIGYGLVLGWDQLGWITFGILTFLMIVGFVADLLAGQFGARIGGASCLAIAVGTIGGLVLGIAASFVGTPIVGCLAGVGGTLGGIVLIERTRHEDWEHAITATKGYVAGTTAGVMVKVTAGGFMIGVFLISVWFG